MNDEARPDATPSEPENPENEAGAEEILAAAADTEEQAGDSDPSAAESEGAEADASEQDADSGLAPKLERLQKILAQAGVSSRRHAENLITEGRVQVNGKVVTELGTKADAARDHIRVDGKLLQGSERLRYYMLNKPRGFVTTVSDPEGRPTVMQFFAKLRERLYPVGRLDYLSEGLLLVTNDGDLANKLTRAAAGVEKTYLVKVSGEPTEEELDRLRLGVGIERGKPGSAKVQTAPAQIRKVRQGDNPWFEVVLIEGRNRELRKMFEEIGHHVEKIRRVGYGPLVLDIEPGKIRELEAEELEDLRKASDGKLRKPKSKDKNRKAAHAQLPTLRPRQDDSDSAPQPASRSTFPPRREFLPKKQFGTGRPPRPASSAAEGFRPRSEHPGKRSATFGAQHPGRPPFGKGPQRSGRPPFSADRPTWKKNDRAPQSPARFGSGPTTPSSFGQQPPRDDRPRREFPSEARTGGKRPFENKPWKKPAGERSAFQPRTNPRRDEEPRQEISRSPKAPRLHIEPVEREADVRPTPSRPPFRGAAPDRRPDARPAQFPPRSDRERSDRRRFDRPASDRPRQDRPRFDRPTPSRSFSDRPSLDRPSSNRPSSARPSGGPGRTGRTFGADRPAREGANRSRPFTTSTGQPRPGGARPSNKRSGAPAAGKPAWKPKPSGAGHPSSTGRSKPSFGAARPGGFSKSGSGYKGKAGARPGSGPRPGGKRPGGKPGGKKRS